MKKNDYVLIHRIQRLCTNWETALSHGLKTASVFKNIVSGNLTTEVPNTSFWDFAYHHLTAHEKERFSTLRYGQFYINLITHLLSDCNNLFIQYM